MRETWLSKIRVVMVSPGFPKGCEAQIGTRIICKWILTTPLVLMTMVGMRVDLVWKMEESFKRAPVNLEMYLKAKIPNASKSLEGGHVGLKFQSKMLRMW